MIVDKNNTAPESAFMKPNLAGMQIDRAKTMLEQI